MYAVIKSGGKQYRVESGATLRLEALSADVGAAVSFDQVLLVGARGMGSDCNGAGGEDIELVMPVGTLIRDEETGDLVADLAKDGERALLARGGQGGLGNVHFKSSINRAPRQFTRGEPGESRRLALELRVLADVGLLGLPNAGKSSLIRAVSSARPKVADYPFTTLNPSLGVVRVGHSSFVVADIPGLIEGASEGAGLGHQFLRHLARTKLLLHLVDLTDEDPAANARAIAAELKKYDESLYRKPRWLVFNKIDAVQDAGRVILVSSGAIAEGMQRLGWTRRPHAMHELQAAAAVGQMGLVQCYESCFRALGLRSAQVLLTHDDLADRKR